MDTNLLIMMIILLLIIVILLVSWYIDGLENKLDESKQTKKLYEMTQETYTYFKVMEYLSDAKDKGMTSVSAKEIMRTCPNLHKNDVEKLLERMDRKNI